MRTGPHTLRPTAVWWLLAGLAACCAALAPARSCGVTLEPEPPRAIDAEPQPRGVGHEAKERETVCAWWAELLDSLLARQRLLPGSPARPATGTESGMATTDLLRAAMAGTEGGTDASGLVASRPEDALLAGGVVLDSAESRAARRAEIAALKLQSSVGSKPTTAADVPAAAAGPARLPWWLLAGVGALGAIVAVSLLAAWRSERA